MKNNCYTKNNNRNLILLSIIILYIIYMLYHIISIDISEKIKINMDVINDCDDSDNKQVINSINMKILRQGMNEIFKINIPTNKKISKMENIILDELKYVSNNNDINLNGEVKSNIYVDNEENIVHELDNDSNISKDDNEKSITNINSLIDEKQELITTLKSKDEILKSSVITKMFTFETNIKCAKDIYDYAKILDNTENKIDLKNKKILIFHTHSQEGFKDTTNLKDDGIVGMGKELAEILKEKYGLNVIHYIGEHDIIDGLLSREGSYERVEEAVREILEEDNDIEILIDLHRDGIPESRHLITDINGKQCAQIMLVNGICKLVNNGKLEDIDYLKNEYVNDNLNLSMNVQLAANKLYPDLSRKILVKPYRYSLHMKPNSMLIELGAQNNSVEEVRNTLPYLAEIIYTALENKNNVM